MFAVELFDVLRVGGGEHIEWCGIFNLMRQLSRGGETENRVAAARRFETRTQLLEDGSEVCGRGNCDFRTRNWDRTAPGERQKRGNDRYVSSRHLIV